MRGLPDLWRRDRDLMNFSNLTAPFQQFFDRAFPVDMKDTGEEIIIEAELAGLKRDQINVDVSPEGVSITVKVESDVKEEKEEYYRRERAYGRTERFIEFPVSVKTDEGTATYEDGVLRLTFPKTHVERTKVRRMDIH